MTQVYLDLSGGSFIYHFHLLLFPTSLSVFVISHANPSQNEKQLSPEYFFAEYGTVEDSGSANKMKAIFKTLILLKLWFHSNKWFTLSNLDLYNTQQPAIQWSHESFKILYHMESKHPVLKGKHFKRHKGDYKEKKKLLKASSLLDVSALRASFLEASYIVKAKIFTIGEELVLPAAQDIRCKLFREAAVQFPFC